MKKQLISLILAVAMVFSLACTANAAVYTTVNVTGTRNYTYAFQVLDLVNQERAEEGLSPLTMDTSLLETAMLRAAECSILFDHTRPDGTLCFTANSLMYGENIAYGYTSPTAVMEGWMNSEGHRANILTEGYTTIGIGCVNIGGVWYWVQNFGYSGSTQANASSYSNSSHTWAITVSDSIDDSDEGSYFVEQDNLIYLIEDDQAIVYLCDENATGAITIPSTVGNHPVTGIDYAAFANCTGITSVSIPSSVVSIGYDAFYGCSKLTSVNIPSGVTYIGVNAFYGTPCFESRYSNGVIYMDNWLLYVDVSLSGSLTVKSGTVGIAEMAVSDCAELTSVTIPSGVKYINNQAFADCTSLNSVIFQGDAPVMEEDAFTNVTATVGYPSQNTTWNGSTKLNYGGSLTWSGLRFVDLPDTAWYTTYANQAADLGLMDGIGNNLFSPSGTTTRAMFVQILYAMAGKPSVGAGNPFKDVSSAQWYADAVQWAYEESVTDGISATAFGPNQNVTREQVAVFLYAYYGRPEVNGDLSGFIDADQVHSWAETAVIWATQNGIIDGSLNQDGTLSLNPRGNATRAETATMMVGFYNLINS